MNSSIRFPRRPLVLALSLALGVVDAAAATITVMDGTDDSSSLDCTLRQALTSAVFDTSTGGCTGGDGADTIVFDGSLQNATITLTQGALTVQLMHSAVAVQGSGQTLYADGSSRVISANLYDSSLSLSNVTLTHGNAGSSGGGGMYLYTAIVVAPRTTAFPVNSVKLDHVTVSNNLGGRYAAGIAAVAPVDLTLRHCTVSGNSGYATAPGMAGGIYVSAGSSLSITDSTISGNTVMGGPGYVSGGIYSLGGSVRLTNSTVAGNTAYAFGYFAGGLWIGGAYPIVALQDSTITGNLASNFFIPGAGSVLGPASIYYTFGAGGVAVYTSTAYLYGANTILSANAINDAPNVAAPLPPSPYADLRLTLGDSVGLQSCLLGSALQAQGFYGYGNVFSDVPGLMPLADNGGPTQTMALLETSPALNSGDPSQAIYVHAGIVTGLHFDQRGYGFPRMLDGYVDIGAYQHQDDRIFADGHEAEP